VDEAEAVRETVAILKEADLSPLEVHRLGTLEEREKAGEEIDEEERALMERALAGKLGRRGRDDAVLRLKSYTGRSSVVFAFASLQTHLQAEPSRSAPQEGSRKATQNCWT
jgi:hypothetical protein